ncbi:MAG: DUF1553 domain-containing protein [Bacteroidota bacterium]
MKTLLSFLLGLGISWGIFSLSTPSPSEGTFAESLPDEVDYNFHIRPILSDKCFACHGPDAANRKAGLRLDLADAAFEELPESPGKHAFIAGNTKKSEAIQRILSSDPEIQMPPPESHLSLTDREIALLKKWVDQGAMYKKHWSFVAPTIPEIPKVSQQDWPKDAIDYFVLEKLEGKGLGASPQATSEQLIRRVYFSLTGLPPSTEAIDTFVADSSLNAYEELIDSLLQTTAYGERMAAHWMDVARYADSDGYLDDKHRDFFPWRDWVIKAFNNNLSYKEFVTWQLAGDLLPNATQEQILATAFNRLHKKNSEAGIVFEEYRVEYVADRTNTLGKAILGLSLECARCHDHKYDPLSQKNYFQLFSFFNSTFETGHAMYGPDQTPGPALLLANREVQARKEFLEKQVAREEKNLMNAQGELQLGQPFTLHPPQVKKSLREALVAHYSFDKIVSTDKDQAWTPEVGGKAGKASLTRPLVKKGKYGKGFFTTDYNGGVLGDKVGWYERTEPFSIELWIYPDTTYAEAGVFTHCEDFRLGYKGYSLHLKDNRLSFIMAHSWPQNSIQVTTRKRLAPKTWTHVVITYSGNSQASGTNLYIDGKLAEVEVEQDHLYKGILYAYNIHTYGFRGIQIGQRDKITPFKQGGIDEFKVYKKALSPLEVQLAFDPQTPSISNDLLHAHQNSQLENEYALSGALRHYRDSLNLWVNAIPEIMVLGDLPKPRPTFVLDRGLYDSPTEPVEPQTPESVLPFDPKLPKNRLGLTQWLFDPQNPLTARVIVNQIWQLHFGRGLVKTSDDLGNQGELPSHPELLDHLATWFIDSGWDLKALHKKILLSASYQQASFLRAEMKEIDPENVLLARGPRFRLPAEMIRDNALAISGLLVDSVGGPSVYPYQPEGLWDEISNKHWRYQYLQEPGPGLYRRSLYSVWKRTSPPPAMQIFDVGERGTCRVRRQVTATPLQALVLLNDPQYQEAARVLAEKLVSKYGASLDTQLKQGYKHIIGRNPDEKEEEMLREFYAMEWDHFNASPNLANQYLCNGEQEAANEMELVHLAALGVVMNGLMNTDEAVMLN